MPDDLSVNIASSHSLRSVVQAAIRDPDPVCILENELLYGQTFPVPDAALDPDFTLPIGKAKVMKEGTDVTLVTFSKMVCSPLLFLSYRKRFQRSNKEVCMWRLWPRGCCCHNRI